MMTEAVLAKGLVERIGIEGSRVRHEKTGLEPLKFDTPIPDHKVGIKVVLDTLLDGDQGVIKNLEELRAVGHRVVHGGEKFARSVVVNPEVLKVVEECCPLAPLHNPANLMGIRAMMEVHRCSPGRRFDTAFHQTMPDYAYTYGLPYHYYEKHRVRRYGFHGTSHFYVAHRAAEMMGRPIEDLKIVTCHLGNGSSISAVKRGKSIDTSLGFGTVPGVLMGTRCGDIDPTVILYIMEHEEIDPKSMSHIIHKESGFKGITGISSDLRMWRRPGNGKARLAPWTSFYGSESISVPMPVLWGYRRHRIHRRDSARTA